MTTMNPSLLVAQAPVVPVLVMGVISLLALAVCVLLCVVVLVLLRDLREQRRATDELRAQPAPSRKRTAPAKRPATPPAEVSATASATATDEEDPAPA